MLIEYTFSLRGDISFRNDLQLDYNVYKYRFISEGPQTGKIVIRVKGDISSEVCTVRTEVQNGKATHHVQVREGKHLPFIQKDLQVLEGLMSPFGLEEINTATPKVRWIAETSEEEDLIKMKEYEIGLSPRQPSPPIETELLARIVLGSFSAYELEIPLAFYRKAFVSYKERRYLNACFDYFFFLEALYAEGKFKTRDVKAKFLAAKELQGAIEAALKDDFFIREMKYISQSKYQKEIEGKTPAEISDFLIDFRGHIHHYSSKDKGRWHPTRPERIEFEATLYKHIAFYIAMKMIDESLYNDKIDIGKITPRRLKKA